MERDNRILDSPQNHREPLAVCSPARVAPINFGVQPHIPHPVPGNDPFGPAPGPVPVIYKEQQYNHLPAALAQQLAVLAPLPAPQRRGHGCGHGHDQGNAAAPPPVMVCTFYSLCPLPKL